MSSCNKHILYFVKHYARISRYSQNKQQLFTPNTINWLFFLMARHCLQPWTKIFEYYLHEFRTPNEFNFFCFNYFEWTQGGVSVG